MDAQLYQSETVVDGRTKALVQQSSDVVLATHVEPKDDMITERSRASFDTKGLAEHLNGGREKLQRLYAQGSPTVLCPRTKFSCLANEHKRYVCTLLFTAFLCDTFTEESWPICFTSKIGATSHSGTTSIDRTLMKGL